MTPEDIYFTELARDPSNQDVRRMFADHCEESGDMYKANCLRWMADNGKYPDDESDSHFKSWDWWLRSAKHPEEHSSLPFDLFTLLIPNHSLVDSRTDQLPAFKCWNTLREAEEALYLAWKMRAEKDGVLEEEAQEVVTP